MFSASSAIAHRADNYTAPILNHIVFLTMGIALAWAIHFIPYKIIRILGFLGLITSLILLLYMLLPGRGVTLNHATRWVEIMGIRFQPSEIAKLSIVIVVADFLTRIKENDPASEKKWFRYIMATVGIFCSIIFINNVSTAILIFAIVFLMMLISRISLKRLGIISLVGLLVILGGYGTGKAMQNLPADSGIRNIPAFNRIPTMTARIDRFFVADENRFTLNDENRQANNAIIAIARGGGGIFGVWFGNSVQRDYLTFAYSDFIYAIAVEEGGLALGVFLILLYLILVFRAGKIAMKCNAVFPALLVIGLSLMIAVQAFISMAVTVGIGPVTGQPLPLISHGGTAIVITSVYFGIILGVTKQLKENQQAQAEGTIEDIPAVELESLELKNTTI